MDGETGLVRGVDMSKEKAMFFRRQKISEHSELKYDGFNHFIL